MAAKKARNVETAKDSDNSVTTSGTDVENQVNRNGAGSRNNIERVGTSRVETDDFSIGRQYGQ